MDRIEHFVVRASSFVFVLVFDLTGMEFENGCVPHFIKESTLSSCRDPLTEFQNDLTLGVP